MAHGRHFRRIRRIEGVLLDDNDLRTIEKRLEICNQGIAKQQRV